MIQPIPPHRNKLITGDAIVKASKKVLQEKKDENLQQVQKVMEALNKTIQEGEEAFQKYIATPPVVTNPVLKSILKFFLLKTKSKDTFSSYATKQKMKERLSLVENWKSLFGVPHDDIVPNVLIVKFEVLDDDDNEDGEMAF